MQDLSANSWLEFLVRIAKQARMLPCGNTDYVSVLVFLLTRLAAGDPIAVLLGDQASLEDIAQARQRYGLDQPLVSQFMLWLGEVLQGNLGQSIFLQMPVTQVLWERVEPTACLAFLSVSLAMLIGVPCGIVSAVWRGRWIDQCVSTLAMLGASMPSFWMGLMVIQLLAVGAGWASTTGVGTASANAAVATTRRAVFRVILVSDWRGWSGHSRSLGCRHVPLNLPAALSPLNKPACALSFAVDSR